MRLPMQRLRRISPEAGRCAYQALKYRFADMKAWLEASHAIADETARAVQAGHGSASFGTPSAAVTR